jgi:uncharacterized protein YcsI (UPF0317 family)
MTTIEDPSALSPVEARALFRAGTNTPTSGWAAGHTPGQPHLMASHHTTLAGNPHHR